MFIRNLLTVQYIAMDFLQIGQHEKYRVFYLRTCYQAGRDKEFVQLTPVPFLPLRLLWQGAFKKIPGFFSQRT